MASLQMFTVQFLKKNRSKRWKNKRYAACYNIKSILNAIWSSKQNNKLAIRLKNFTNALVDRLKSWSRSPFRSCISQTLRCVAWRQKHNFYMYKLFPILGKQNCVTISLKWSVALNIIKMWRRILQYKETFTVNSSAWFEVNNGPQ